MRWACNQFLHWRVPARRLRSVVPAPLEVDTHDGEGWVSAVALRTQATRLGPLPAGEQDYAQVNLRTYVRHNGRAGIWLLGTFASDPMACRGARFLGLPYWEADAHVEPGYAEVGRGFRASWEGAGDGATNGLDAFLAERRHLYARAGGHFLRIDAHHEPWELRRAEGRVHAGRLLPRRLRRRPPDLAHVAGDVDVRLERPWRIV